MKILEELLASYEKIKKRQFFLKEEADPEQMAQQLLSKSTSDPGTWYSVPDGMGFPSKPQQAAIRTAVPTDKNPNPKTTFYKGGNYNVGIFQNGSILDQSGYENYVSHFKSGGVEEMGSSEEDLPVADPLLDSLLPTYDKEFSDIMSYGERLSNLIQGLESQDRKLVQYLKGFLNTLKPSVLNAKRIKIGVSPRHTGALEPANPMHIKRAVKSLQEYMRMAVHPPESVSDLRAFRKLFALHNDKIIFRDSADPEMGLVLSTNSMYGSYLKAAYQTFFLNCKKRGVGEPEDRVPDVIASTGANSNDLGIFSEQFQVVVGHLINGDKESAKKSLIDIINVTGAKIQGDMQFIKQIETLELGLDLEDLGYSDMIKTITREFGNNPIIPMLKSFVNHSRDLVRRKPLRVENIGTQTTGLTSKTDILETYGSHEEAFQKALETGFDEETAAELTSGGSQLMTSMKAYLDPNEVKLGNLGVERTLNSVLAPKTPIEREFVENSFKKLNIINRVGVKKLFTTFNNLQKSMETVFNAKTVTGKDGKPILASTIQKSILNDLSKKIRNRLGFSELERASILKAIENYDLDDQNERYYAISDLTRRCIVSKLKGDILSEDPEKNKTARESLAVFIRLNAASNRETMLDVRGLLTGEKYICAQNKVLDKFLNGMLNDNPLVTISNDSRAESSIRIYDAKDKTQSIAIKFIIDKSGQKGTVGSNRAQTEIEMSRGVLKAHNIFKDTPNLALEEKFILNFKKLFE